MNQLSATAQHYHDIESPISRGNYGDLRIRAANLLKNPALSVLEVEQQIAGEARKLLRRGCGKQKDEHAADVALQVMSDVISKQSEERRREYAISNGEDV